MAIATSDKVTESIRKAASPFSGEVDDYNQLLALIGNARLCLLGEATHGTHDFYREGWLATLEVFATDAGAQQEVSDVPFEGISLDSDNDKSLVINIGKTPADHVSHQIDHPVHIWLQQTDAGADAALEFEAEDDSKTLLRFRSPMLPEFVDGVVLD